MNNSRCNVVRILMILGTAIGVADRAAAAPITWLVTGPVSRTEGGFIGSLPLGSTASLALTFEPMTANVLPGCPPGSGVFAAIQGGSLTFLDVKVTLLGGAIELNAPNGNCGTTASGLVEFHAFSSVADSYEVLADPFPVNPGAPDLAAILADVNQFGVFVKNSRGLFAFSGPLQQPQLVPEPATLTLLGTGLIAARLARRRRGVAETRAISNHLGRT